MKKKKMLVNELFPPVDSLFSSMNYDFQIISKDKLDLIFLLSEGERYVDAIVDYYVDDSALTSTAMSSLADLTLGFYKEKWDRLIKIYSIEYDPIHNFSDDLVESITDEEAELKKNTGTRSNTGTQQNSGSRSNTGTQQNNGTTQNTGTQLNEGSESSTDNDLIYGLNSSVGVGANDQLGQRSNQNTRTDNLSEAKNFTRTDNLSEATTSTRTDNLIRTDDLKEDSNRNYTRGRTLSRLGNIGNITTQKMLTEEIELWKWNFVWQVIEDVTSLLCLPLYRNEVI